MTGLLWVPVFAQSLQDLERLQKQLEESLRSSASQTMPLEDIDADTPTLIQMTVPEPDSIQIDERYFGYQFFNYRTQIDLWENLPVPGDYRLGAGDEIIISLWGDTQLRGQFTINRSGSIYVEEVGQLSLSGKTLTGARKYISRHFSQVYSTLKNPNPNTFIDVSLGTLKLINVSFVGEVNHPGIHSIHPFSRVTTGLIQAGGVAISGTLRGIQVIRDDKVEATVDLYSFLLKGQGATDVQLRDQDVVYVPVRKSTITIDGEVHRPAIYEALPGEKLTTLLAYSGQFKSKAGIKIQIDRIIPANERVSDDAAVRTDYVGPAEFDTHFIQDGDHITVKSIFSVDNEVYIYGQVKRPGAFGFTDSLKLMDLLKLAGGIDDDSYWKSVYTARAELIRRNVGSDYATTIPINLEKLRQGDESQNLILQNLDQVIVRPNPFFDAPQNVTVLGEISIPGVYVILRDAETLQDIFDRAGGFTGRAFEMGITMRRAGDRVLLRDYTIPVADGDSIMIPVHPGTVRVMGEVYTPGLVHFRRGMSLNDYIENAGGFTLEAKKNKISVTYADGNVKIKKLLRSPRIKEGATVTVYTKEESVPFDPTTLLTNLASIAASLTTLIIILNSAP